MVLCCKDNGFGSRMFPARQIGVMTHGTGTPAIAFTQDETA
ncbi:hypothetical protein roselon_02786 [Roseibacterium elongatum DSM 19469]|uniref:Uncharacterized protein n=1 Tax=Roseicyclus elongatus DSM 19469 TaxID=1294273 RepID=W8RV55_9RHOB|nr:hypothetical protein roselon_02786 [Roseibacterium elongatum DSM 19469]